MRPAFILRYKGRITLVPRKRRKLRRRHELKRTSIFDRIARQSRVIKARPGAQVNFLIEKFRNKLRASDQAALLRAELQSLLTSAPAEHRPAA